MTLADIQPILDALIAAIFAAIAGLIAIYVPKGIAAFEARTHIALTAQQQATVMQAATTAAGILETKLSQGVLAIQDIDVNNTAVVAQANAAVARVPDAAAALNKSVPSMAQTIVGLVKTTPVAKAAVISPVAPIPLIPLVPRGAA